MAFFDWDSNGINDFTDDFIEFNVFMDSEEDEEYRPPRYTPNRSNKESEFKGFLSVMACLWAPCIICYILGTENPVVALVLYILMLPILFKIAKSNNKKED